MIENTAALVTTRQITSRRKPDGFPIVIKEWPRNSSEIVRVALDWFDGSLTVDIRCWWRDADGVFKPKREGLTLPIKHVSKLAAALGDARQRLDQKTPDGTTTAIASSSPCCSRGHSTNWSARLPVIARPAPDA